VPFLPLALKVVEARWFSLICTIARSLDPRCSQELKPRSILPLYLSVSSRWRPRKKTSSLVLDCSSCTNMVQ
jgi:hypothetical protein